MLYPIPKRQLVSADTHAYHDTIFTQEEINTILALPEWSNNAPATVGQSNAVNQNIRVSNVSWLGPTQETAWIWEKIVCAAANVNSQFFGFDLTGCYEQIQLGIYSAENNGNYGWHTDASARDRTAPRKLSMSLILSDSSEYEGGELQIKTDSDNAITLNTPKGRAWFFPSYTLHRVAPVTRGVRKSLVLWMGGPAFK